MVKSLPSGLAASLAQTTTTLATLWQITRTDGVTFFFTDHDVDIVYEGDTYLSAVGYTRTAVENGVGLTVDNMDVGGFLDSSAITESDLRAGKFDFAGVLILLVDWSDLSKGAMILRRGTFGEVIFSDSGLFQTEIRGLVQAYAQSIVDEYQPECRANLGDFRCKVPIAPPLVERSTAYEVGDYIRVNLGGAEPPLTEDYHDLIFQCTTAGTTAAAAPVYDETVGSSTTDGTAVFVAQEGWMRAATVLSVSDENRTFTISVNEPRATPSAEAAEDAAELTVLQQMVALMQNNEPNGVTLTQPTSSPALPWFTGGMVVWDTGANAGTSMEIRDWDSSTSTVTLFLGMPFEIQVGDKLGIYPGCSKLIPACAKKFNNVLNFRGEPYVPGQDAVLQFGVAPVSS